MANKKKYKYAAGSFAPEGGGFLQKVKEFFSEIGEVISEQLGGVKKPKYSSMSDYDRRREQKRLESARKEKLLFAAILILPLIAALVMVASCNCDACSSCEGCSSCERDENIPLTRQDEEFRKVFDEAEEVFSWFTGCNEPRYDEEDYQLGRYEGEYYYRVTERGIESLDELRAVCSEHFTEELVEELLATRVYGDVYLFAEFEGKLYYYGGFVGAAEWTIGERVGRITSQSETEMVYSMEMSYDYYSHTFETSFDYIYTLCEDGIWRFSKFELPAELIALEMFGDGTNGSPEESQQ